MNNKACCFSGLGRHGEPIGGGISTRGYMRPDCPQEEAQYSQVSCNNTNKKNSEFFIHYILLFLLTTEEIN